MIDRIGKNSGGFMGGTPKYLHARSESNFECAALAGSVHGGLFPDVSDSRQTRPDQTRPGRTGMDPSELGLTGSDIDAAQEDGVESGMNH
jgi:hypothetical protein